MTPQEFLSAVPPIQVEYWADGKKLATRLIPALHERFEEHSVFFCCNVCQQVWGWIYYPNRFWYYSYQDCYLHNSRRYAEENLPGSMLGPGAYELDTFPLAVLQREFLLHLNEIERKLHEQEIREAANPPRA